MTEEQRILLDDFTKKVKFMKEQLREKSSDNEKLKAALESANTDLEKILGENEKLKYDNNVLRVSRSLEKNSDSGFTKKRIGDLVREIDKCIELLNE